MNINYKETQLDFLHASAMSSQDPRSPRVLSAQMVLSVENLVILSIMSIMVMIFCFSLGVERGKRVALSDVNGISVAPASASVKTPVKAAPAVMDKKVVADDADALEDKPKANILTGVMAMFGGPKEAADPAPAVTQAKAPEPVAEAKAVKTVQADAARDKAPKPSQVVQSQSPAAKSANGAYTVQVASYKTETYANREADNLKQKGYRDVYVVPKGAFVILCVGNFSTKSDANAYTGKLKSRYQETLVRRL